MSLLHQVKEHQTNFFIHKTNIITLMIIIRMIFTKMWYNRVTQTNGTHMHKTFLAILQSHSVQEVSVHLALHSSTYWTCVHTHTHRQIDRQDGRTQTCELTISEKNQLNALTFFWSSLLLLIVPPQISYQRPVALAAGTLYTPPPERILHISGVKSLIKQYTQLFSLLQSLMF